MDGIRYSQLALRSDTGIAMLSSMLRGATDEVVGEAFTMTHPQILDDFAWLRDARVGVTLLADPEVYNLKSAAAASRDALESRGVLLIDYGTYPRKVHVKALSVDQTSSWVSSATVMDQGREVLDFSARLEGDSARAVWALTTSAITDSRSAQRAVADDAARHGVLLNDRHAGITQLRDGIEALMRSASEELVIATKSFTDGGVARELVTARRKSGLDVYLVSQLEKTGQDVLDILDDGGIQLRNDYAGSLHINTVIADRRRAYAGSAHLTGRAMVREAGRRDSREMGVLLTDPHGVARLRDDVVAFTQNMQPVE